MAKKRLPDLPLITTPADEAVVWVYDGDEVDKDRRWRLANIVSYFTGKFNDIYARRTQNLADLSSAPDARDNLGLGSAATQNDDKYAHRSNNLSDLADAGLSRDNLGLGSAATLDAGTGPDNVPQNSDLGSAAYLDTGSDQSEVVINSGLLRTRTVTAATTVELTDHLGCIVVDAATADITVPDALPVGFRFKVFKISSYDTTNTDSVDILTSGTEVATVAQLTTVPLYGNGGNWTLEKVSSTRWEIVAGWDAGENSNGTWSRDSGGFQTFLHRQVDGRTASGNFTFTWTFPISMINTDYVMTRAAETGVPDEISGGSQVDFTTSSTGIRAYRSASTPSQWRLKAEGRWYALS